MKLVSCIVPAIAGPAFAFSHSIGVLRPSRALRALQWDDCGHSRFGARELADISFEAAFSRCPLIAVLRGVGRDNVEAVGSALAQEGVRLISVPAESQAGWEGLARLVHVLGADEPGASVAVGAATVISVSQGHTRAQIAACMRHKQVDAAAAAGATFISCPHTDGDIIRRATDLGMTVTPGVMTPTEAFTAIRHGAKFLKLFPSQAFSPAMFKSLRAVTPPNIKLIVSGGMTPGLMKEYVQVGAYGFALGSSLYHPSLSMDQLRERARVFVAVATGTR